MEFGQLCRMRVFPFDRVFIASSEEINPLQALLQQGLCRLGQTLEFEESLGGGSFHAVIRQPGLRIPAKIEARIDVSIAPGLALFVRKGASQAELGDGGCESCVFQGGVWDPCRYPGDLSGEVSSWWADNVDPGLLTVSDEAPPCPGWSCSVYPLVLERT